MLLLWSHRMVSVVLSVSLLCSCAVQKWLGDRGRALGGDSCYMRWGHQYPYGERKGRGGMFCLLLSIQTFLAFSAAFAKPLWATPWFGGQRRGLRPETSWVWRCPAVPQLFSEAWKFQQLTTVVTVLLYSLLSCCRLAPSSIRTVSLNEDQLRLGT